MIHTPRPTPRRLALIRLDGVNNGSNTPGLVTYMAPPPPPAAPAPTPAWIEQTPWYAWLTAAGAALWLWKGFKR